MSKEDFKILKSAIDTFFIKKANKSRAVDNYENGRFPRANLVKDLQMRFCFDVFYEAQKSGMLDVSLFSNEYTDSHIYTAMRKCLPVLTRKY